MIYSLLIIAFLALFSASSVNALSSGSPICRATQLTDIGASMAATDGSGEGWSITASSSTYTPGQTITFTISNTDTAKTFAGLLVFVDKTGTTTSVGSFTDKTGMKNPTCATAKNAITHSDATAKASGFTLQWTAPSTSEGALTARIAVVTSNSGRKMQFTSVALTESASTTAAPVTTTTVKPNSANQSGPVMMVIGTMMAMGLAIMKIGF